MKRTALKIIAGLGLLVMVPTVAMAHTNLSIGVDLGGGYYEPAYAVAPSVVYEASAPVYYGPSYYGPGVVYEHSYGYGHGYEYGPRHWDGYRR